MSTEPNGKTPPNTAPDSHWYVRSADAEQPPHELVISPSQAICEALATLGRDAPAAEVRRLLNQKGLDVEEATIDRVRAGLSCGPEETR